MKRKREKSAWAPPVASVRAGPAPTVTETATRRVWRLGWNTQDAKAALETAIVSQLTLEAIRKMKAMGPAGAEYFELFQNRVDSGAYSTFAPGWRYVLGGLDGSWLFLLSLLLEHQPDATPDDAKRLLATEAEQVRVGVSYVAPDFFAAVTIQMRDKTVTAEQADAAGRQLAAAVLETVYGATATAPAPTPTAGPGTAPA